MKDYRLTLELILEAAQKISDYSAGLDFDDFSPLLHQAPQEIQGNRCLQGQRVTKS